jgi:hypothetical protein
MAFHILNLGCGVQSTALYLMSTRGEEPQFVPRYNAAIFADTGDEPDAVYCHLEWLKTLGGPPIFVDSHGVLSHDLIHGHHHSLRGEGCKYRPGQMIARYDRIPAFVLQDDGKRGIMPRECTRAYKIAVVENFIRRYILGVPKGRQVPAGISVDQHFGLSYDEAGRIIRVKARFQKLAWSRPNFPLFDLEMTRGDCATYNRGIVPHEVPRSACIFCPYKSNEEWRKLRDGSPQEWEEACRLDESLRRPDAACAQDLTGKLFVHPSRVPLRMAPIDGPASREAAGPDSECEGACFV